MTKIKKRLKYIYIKKYQLNEQLLKKLIYKSICYNNKIKNQAKFSLPIKKKKKRLNFWLNCCFFNALYKQMWHKNLICRFMLKRLNRNACINNITVYKT